MAAPEKTERRLTLETAVQQFGTALTAREGARMRLIKRTAVRCVSASVSAEGASPDVRVKHCSLYLRKERAKVRCRPIHIWQSALAL